MHTACEMTGIHLPHCNKHTVICTSMYTQYIHKSRDSPQMHQEEKEYGAEIWQMTQILFRMPKIYSQLIKPMSIEIDLS